MADQMLSVLYERAIQTKADVKRESVRGGDDTISKKTLRMIDEAAKLLKRTVIDRRGEANGRAVLTKKAVNRIRCFDRRKIKPRGWKSEFAREYGVSPATITRVLAGDRWKTKES